MKLVELQGKAFRFRLKDQLNQLRNYIPTNLYFQFWLSSQFPWLS